MRAHTIYEYVEMKQSLYITSIAHGLVIAEFKDLIEDSYVNNSFEHRALSAMFDNLNPSNQCTSLNGNAGEATNSDDQEVMKCVNVGCEVLKHWHRKPSGKAPLKGAARRAAEKIKICKDTCEIAKLILCVQPLDSCPYPHSNHFHITSAQTREVGNLVADCMRDDVERLLGDEDGRAEFLEAYPTQDAEPLLIDLQEESKGNRKDTVAAKHLPSTFAQLQSMQVMDDLHLEVQLGAPQLIQEKTLDNYIKQECSGWPDSDYSIAPGKTETTIMPHFGEGHATKGFSEFGDAEEFEHKSIEPPQPIAGPVPMWTPSRVEQLEQPLDNRFVFARALGNPKETYVSAGDMYYKLIHDKLVRYTPGVGFEECMVSRFRVTDEGQTIRGGKLGHGCYTGVGDKEFILTSRLQYVKNFIYRSSDIRWFSNLRKGAILLWRDVTFDNFVLTPYSLKVNLKQDIWYDRVMIAELGVKIAAGFSKDTAKVLLKYVDANFKYIPPEIVIPTMVYFCHMRAQVFCETTAINDTLNEMKDGIVLSKYVEPRAGNHELAQLCRGALGEEGVIDILDSNDRIHSKCIMRINYEKSSDYGQTDKSRDVLVGRKYTAILDKTQGCTFVSPYVTFNTRISRKLEVGYESSGYLFGTRMAIIDTNDTTEIEKSLLRLTQDRKDEWELRQAQIDLYQPIVNSFDRGEQADLTEYIRNFDEEYTPDAPVVESRLSDLQILLQDIQKLERRHGIDDKLYARLLSDPVDALRQYIEDVGAKLPIRRVELEKYIEDNDPRSAKFTLCAAKPDESQKYKDIDGEIRLKFCRLIISIIGQDWVLAQPALMYILKILLEKNLIIESTREGCRIQYGDEIYHSRARIKQNLYYRANLHETSLEGRSHVAEEQHEWLSGQRAGVCASSHGDDMDAVVKHENGAIIYEEADISDNDTSYTDTRIRMIYSLLNSKLACTETFAQLAKPNRIINPAAEEEFLTLHSLVGMGMKSGSIATTCINTFGSRDIHIAKCVYGTSYSTAARTCGFLVTSKKFDKIGRSTFLSSYMTQVLILGKLRHVAHPCYGGLLRGFGRKAGDLLGGKKLPLSKKSRMMIQERLKGVLHYPLTLLLQALFRKFNVKYDVCNEEYSILDVVASKFLPLHEWMLSNNDRQLILHYYGEEDYFDGLIHYKALIKMITDSPDYGVCINSNFVDRVMWVRYGMPPVCK